MRTLPVIALGLVLLSPPGRAIAEGRQRLDHRGALGLSLAAGVEHASVVLVSDRTGADVNRLTLDLDATLGLGTEGNEIAILARFLHLRDTGAALGVRYRAYFGRDEAKTFFELGLKADTAPHIAVGPMGAFGFMYELSPVLGAYARAEVSAEAGQGLRFGGAFQLGIQGRTYVLE